MGGFQGSEREFPITSDKYLQFEVIDFIIIKRLKFSIQNFVTLRSRRGGFRVLEYNFHLFSSTTQDKKKITFLICSIKAKAKK